MPARHRKANRVVAGEKMRGAQKLARIPVKVPTSAALPRKPDWIRVRLPSGGGVKRLKGMLREQGLHTVCEEAACPNLPECFGGGTATFMIMGDICTRRCPFCDVAHGRPLPLDESEPARLARTVRDMGLRYVVITSVDRDDLRDGGAGHFVACISSIRQLDHPPAIEILVPDFRGRMRVALESLAQAPPDVFNHNLETVPRLYSRVRPGADYQWSLDLIREFKSQHPALPAKSGLMLGLGETLDEVENVLRDLHRHGCEMVTLGQYLQPSRHHLPVSRFVHPEEFSELAAKAKAIGFERVAAGPMVRSSYHADLQVSGEFSDHATEAD